MKREIKFRAFDEGKMIYEHNIEHLIKEDNMILRLAKFWINIRNDSIIMQYTGIKDKNGKEIYEGDIIKESWVDCCITDNGCSGANYGEFCYDHVIKSKIFIATFDLNYENILIYPQNNTNCENLTEEDELYGYIAGIEIIGNIYENPELLK